MCSSALFDPLVQPLPNSPLVQCAIRAPSTPLRDPVGGVGCWPLRPVIQAGPLCGTRKTAGHRRPTFMQGPSPSTQPPRDPIHRRFSPRTTHPPQCKGAVALFHPRHLRRCRSPPPFQAARPLRCLRLRHPPLLSTTRCFCSRPHCPSWVPVFWRLRPQRSLRQSLPPASLCGIPRCPRHWRRLCLRDGDGHSHPRRGTWPLRCCCPYSVHMQPFRFCNAHLRHSLPKVLGGCCQALSAHLRTNRRELVPR